MGRHVLKSFKSGDNVEFLKWKSKAIAKVYETIGKDAERTETRGSSYGREHPLYHIER